MASEFVRFDHRPSRGDDGSADPSHNNDVDPQPQRSGSDIRVPRSAAFNILRPETAESLFVLFQLTGDNVYREWGWEIFRAIEEFCRTEIAYASLVDVEDHTKGAQDRMESFFLSETLKYLYLLQDPDTDMNVLDKYIMNTEAHPLRPLSQVTPRVRKTNETVATANATTPTTSSESSERTNES